MCKIILYINDNSTDGTTEVINKLVNKFKNCEIDFYIHSWSKRAEDKILSTYNPKNFLIEDQKVVIIDDVLFSGRSIRAALTAIQSYGRPESIELLVLIDRRFSRHLPIQPDYRGRQVDAINEERVLVSWKENNKKDAVYIEQT